MNYEKAGKQLICPHCGTTDFKKTSAQLNTAGMTLLGLDWLNESAETYCCMNCGRIEWYAKELGNTADKEADTREKCTCCGRNLGQNTKECSKCGWINA